MERALGLLYRFGNHKCTYSLSPSFRGEKAWSPLNLALSPSTFVISYLLPLLSSHDLPRRPHELAHFLLCSNSCFCPAIVLGQITHHVLTFSCQKSQDKAANPAPLVHPSGIQRRGSHTSQHLKWWGNKESYRETKEHFIEWSTSKGTIYFHTKNTKHFVCVFSSLFFLMGIYSKLLSS